MAPRSPRSAAVVATVVLLALALAGCGQARPRAAHPQVTTAPHAVRTSRPATVATDPVTAPPTSPPSTAPATPVAAHPDRLRPGQQPPQFVLVSFDGAGWHEQWRHWFRVAQQVPFHFTGFLSGTYLLSYDTRDHYHPPYYPAGTSEIGWNDPADVPVEIRDLNHALASGDEIGTHYNGHFCVGAGEPSGGNSWSTRQWNIELDQFFDLLRDYRTNNHLPARDHLDVTADEVKGGRTPCLEGTPDALYPAMAHHGLDYDSSFARGGLSWPTRSRQGVWDMGMAVFPVHGRLPDGRRHVPVTSMDYNYYFTQRGASDDGVSRAESRADSAQVLATYEDMFRAAYRGNRAPVVLGNHFNDWNRDAYRTALTRFVLETCGRKGVRCVTYSELVDWMEQQTPATLRRLQALPPETTS